MRREVTFVVSESTAPQRQPPSVALPKPIPPPPSKPLVVAQNVTKPAVDRPAPVAQPKVPEVPLIQSETKPKDAEPVTEVLTTRQEDPIAEEQDSFHVEEESEPLLLVEEEKPVQQTQNYELSHIESPDVVADAATVPDAKPPSEPYVSYPAPEPPPLQAQTRPPEPPVTVPPAEPPIAQKTPSRPQKKPAPKVSFFQKVIVAKRSSFRRPLPRRSVNRCKKPTCCEKLRKMWGSRSRMLMDTDGDDVAFLSGSGMLSYMRDNTAYS